MRHRHLNHERLTLAAIDDIISRGNRDDWRELRDAAAADELILSKIRKVCASRLSDPQAQRYHLWSQYAQTNQAPAP